MITITPPPQVPLDSPKGHGGNPRAARAKQTAQTTDAVAALAECCLGTRPGLRSTVRGRFCTARAQHGRSPIIS